MTDTELLTVTELCVREGIDLRGDDGQPYCCGVRMNVKAGLIGPDYAKCLTCGKTIGNVASPHICGGVRSNEWLNEHGDRTWMLLNVAGKAGEFLAEELKRDPGPVYYCEYEEEER